MDKDDIPKTTFLIEGKPPVRLYKKRWIILLTYFIIVPISTMQWTQFTLIANIIAEHYNVSFEAVNWTFLVTLINLVVFCYPSCYVVDKFGIKIGALCGMGGTVLAAWIKFFSIPPERFWLIILAQAVLSLPQMCLISLGPKLSANWFGPDEVAMANSIGITGLQLGMALGFILPPILVKKETVERDLRTTAIGLAIICTIAFAMVFIMFADKPFIPPSQAIQKKNEKIQYLKTFNSLIKNVPYLLISLGVGSNAGILCLIQSLLNQIIITHYPDGEKDAGLMGLFMMVFCIIGCCLSGAVLTKFKIYRLHYWFSTLFVSVALIMFLTTLNENIIFPYVGICLYGFFFGTLWNVFYEIVVEITYPEPEAMSIGLVYCLGQSLSVGYIYLYSFLFYDISVTSANYFLITITLVSFVMTFFSKYKMKRTAAGQI